MPIICIEVLVDACSETVVYATTVYSVQMSGGKMYQKSNICENPVLHTQGCFPLYDRARPLDRGSWGTTLGSG